MSPNELETNELIHLRDVREPRPKRPTDHTIILPIPDSELLERRPPTKPGSGDAVLVFGLLALIVLLGGLIAATAFGFLRF